METYLRLPYASASGLEILRRSPRQYQHARSAESESTSALDTGTALHMALLEPLLFEGHYVVIGQCEGHKKDGERCVYQGSVWRDGASYCRTHDPAKDELPDAGVVTLKADEMEVVLGMRDAVQAHTRASTLFEGAGARELTGIWDDPETGVRCKIRPDRLVERARMLVEIKTTRDASEWRFPRDAENRGYFRKVAFYHRGLAALGWKRTATAVLAIESAAPYDMMPYLIDEEDPGLAKADEELSRLLRTLRTCTETDEWPGYEEQLFRPLRRPAYAYRDED